MSRSSALGPTQLPAATNTTLRRTDAASEENAVEVEGDGAPVEEGDSDPPRIPQRRPNPRVAEDARRRAQGDSMAHLLEHRIRGSLKPKAVPPGQQPPPGQQNPLAGLGGRSPFQGPAGKGGKGGPPGQGGKGALTPYAKDHARQALAEEGQLDPSHSYVQHKQTVRRQLDQLGLLETGRDRVHVNDLGHSHGSAVVRTIAGETSLARGADITLDAPPKTPEGQREPGTPHLDRNLKPFGKEDPTVADWAAFETQRLSPALYEMSNRLRALREELPKPPDGKKTFVNMSWGVSPENRANEIAARTLMAEKGTKLYEQAESVLGHPPTLKKTDKGTQLDKAEMDLIKQKLVYPEMSKQMESEPFKKVMAHGRSVLEAELAEGRKAGILVFNSAGNDHVSAESAGSPNMSASVTSGVRGLVRVGATDLKGPGSADDAIAPFSGAGDVSVSAPGVGIPVGVKDGKAVDANGTSFSTPIAVETAYAMSAANPSLSVEDIERLLRDPRATHDIAGTTRDGAGEIDQFAAVLLAKSPNLTRAQIDRARAVLDGNPSATELAKLKAELGLD